MSNYPAKIAVRKANPITLEWIRRLHPKDVAEIGVYKGHTSVEIAKILPVTGSLELFDFTATANAVKKIVQASGPACAVRSFGNTDRYLDSYCWSMGKLLPGGPRWDYVYLDGAHTWAIDGFAVFLIDRLLRPGGYIDLDDYTWTLHASPSLNPRVFPLTGKMYTDDQIKTQQVAMVVELLLLPMGYQEVLAKKIYRKPDV